MFSSVQVLSGNQSTLDWKPILELLMTNRSALILN